jgi:hypothetical protein
MKSSGMESVLAPRKKSGRQTVAVRIDASIAKKAKSVAEDRGIDLSDFLSEALHAVVEREWAKIIKRIDTEHKN